MLKFDTMAPAEMRAAVAAGGGSVWTEAELELKELRGQLGFEWKEIAKQMPGRTDEGRAKPGTVVCSQARRAAGS